MTDRPNLFVFSVSVAGAIVSGLWLVEFILGRDPSWVLGMALFFFLVVGAAAFRMAREYQLSDEGIEASNQRDRVAVAERWAALDPKPEPAPVHDAIRINGRLVERYTAATVHEAAWRTALADFLLFAWAAQSLSGSALVGRAVKGHDDWFVLTEVLMSAGVITKVNGIGTSFNKGWTYRRAVAAVQLGELRLTLPDRMPPRVRHAAEAARPQGKEVSEAESPKSQEKAEKAW